MITVPAIIAEHAYPKAPPCFVPEGDAELRAIGIDEIQAAYMSVALEDTFAVSFTDAEVFSWRTVDDVTRAVERAGRRANHD